MSRLFFSPFSPLITRIQNIGARVARRPRPVPLPVGVAVFIIFVAVIVRGLKLYLDGIG